MTKFPKGWKRVRPGSRIEMGDKFFSITSRRWQKSYRVGDVVEKGGLVYIRKTS